VLDITGISVIFFFY